MRSGRCRSWVKMRNTQPEQMFSGLPPKADIDRGGRHVSNVPVSEVGPSTRSPRGTGEQRCGPQVGYISRYVDGALYRAAIAVRENPHIHRTIVIMLRWAVGVIMQIIAGTIAPTRT